MCTCGMHSVDSQLIMIKTIRWLRTIFHGAVVGNHLNLQHTLNESVAACKYAFAFSHACIAIHPPPRNCHRRCSASSEAACRSDRWRTTSSEPECPWSPRSWREALGSRRLCLHPRPLRRTRTRRQARTVCAHCIWVFFPVGQKKNPKAVIMITAEQKVRLFVLAMCFLRGQKAPQNGRSTVKKVKHRQNEIIFDLREVSCHTKNYSNNRNHT